MNMGRGLVFVLGAALAMGACAPATTTSAPTTGPGGKVYAPGIKPKSSEFAGKAQVLITQAALQQADTARARGLYQQALEQALQGVQKDTTNASHYFYAGQAYAGLGDYAAADTMFARAERIYPAYEQDVDPAREQAWARAFNAGIEAYNAGDSETAIRQWTAAGRIFNKRPESFMNLAIVYAQDEKNDQAIAAYRAGLASLDRQMAREITAEEQTDRADARATMMQQLAQLLLQTEQYADAEQLYRQYVEQNPTDIAAQSNLASVLARQNKTAEANAIYDRLLASPNLSQTDVFNIGVSQFNAKDYARAADAFRKVTEMSARNRDAWYNLVNAHYAQTTAAQQAKNTAGVQKGNQDIIATAPRLLELDPNNETILVILARAYNDAKQGQRATQTVDRLVNLPVYVDDLQLRVGEGKSTVRGSVVGNKARAGSPVTLQVTFYAADGTELGTQSVTVNAPAKEQRASFEATLENPTAAAGYAYKVTP